MSVYYNEIEKMIDKVMTKLLAIQEEPVNLEALDFNQYDLDHINLMIIDLLIIRVIDEYGEIKMNDLNLEINIKYNKLLRKIKNLQYENIVIKEKSLQDSRVNIIKLTDQGKKIIEKISSRENDMIKYLIKDLTVNEEKAVLKFLSRINQRLGHKKDITV
jgi:DNA-binding MarR family transcriptional regulator